MKTIILYALLILPLWASSQVQLKGNVKGNNEPVIWANIILSSPEGKVVAGTLTKEDGSFDLKIKSGSYKIKISYLGFTAQEKDLVIVKDTDLGMITMQPKDGDLQEIKIVAKKKLIEYKTDRLIYNVASSIAASGGNAVGALSTAPGVMIQSKNISILGKGSSRVMIDGRLIELTGDDLINYLNAIAATDIASIEVITNPPAKYEAGGDGGLINIVLKKGIRDSWKNTATMTYDQSTYSFFTLRDNFLYNKDKIKLSMNIGGKLGKLKETESLNTYYPQGLWALNRTGKQKQNNLSGGLAFDYDLSGSTTIGVQYSGNQNNPDTKDLTTIKIGNTSNQLDSLLINDGYNKLTNSSQTYNAHIITRLDTTGKKLSADLDYFNYNSKIDNNFITRTFLPDMKYLNTNQAAKNQSMQDINNYSIKLDMEHPLKFMNLSYGTKLSFINSKADIAYYNTITGDPVLDKTRSNHFEYQENNQAVYVNGNKNITAKLSLQLGLRLENIQTSGYSATANQKTQNNYLKLFPTIYLSYKENENNSFLFNYGRRVNRPVFRDLNPFRSFLNSKSYSEGNPFLQPSYSDNFDFTYVYKENWRTNLFFNITTDGFGIVFNSDPQTNVQTITRQNYFKEYYYGIGQSYTLNLVSWWQSQNLAYLLGSKSVFNKLVNATPKNSAQLYLTTNNTFSLSKETKLQADYFFSSSVKRGLYETGQLSGLNIGIKQSILQNKLQLAALVNDVFNTAYLKNYTSVVNGITQVYGQNNSSRFFRFSLTYSFGNDKINVRQRSFGNDEERKRTD
ncbi:TonB-dependent receptor [Pedobacter lusitanus]|uniref:TonB-dependent receptor n=1 Tax=Pedobacter lusitanus TaxID=1503925 RepID=A0A0D0G2A2_9SPHI|nr:TonB-dependent receptor [Pedobacter lusitanus]KIO78909.1 TonB-dependent receptor [Pedobacter lusitanus]